MRRVVITGLGVVCSLGSTLSEVTRSLQEGRSGLVFMPEMKELGFECNVYAPVRGWDPKRLKKQAKQNMATVGRYALSATKAAIDDSGLEPTELQNDRTGVFVGTAFSGIDTLYNIEYCVKKLKKPSRAGLTGIIKVMNSTISANLAVYYNIKGRTGSISSSFATGLDNIGCGYELIKHGLQDVCICGSSEGDCWKQLGIYFDNWKGMPRNWNHLPAQACRPYDSNRQGFVMSAGAGILILESFDYARNRGAEIYAEVVGYGSANDGHDMFRPNGNGLQSAIYQALATNSNSSPNSIDYINTHGTGTIIGDKIEIMAIKKVFKSNAPLVSSTKGLSGHGLGAAGSQEAIYSLLMLGNEFVASTANLENIASECSGVAHVQDTHDRSLSTIMCINAGLGGTASSIVFVNV